MKKLIHMKRHRPLSLCLYAVAFILIQSSCDLTVRFNGEDVFKSRDRVPRQIKKMRQKPLTSEKGIPLILRDSVFDVEAFRKVSLQDLLKDTISIIEFDKTDSKRGAPKFIAHFVKDTSENETEAKTICVISRMTPDKAIEFIREYNVPYKVYLTDASLRVPGYGRGAKSYWVFPNQ